MYLTEVPVILLFFIALHYNKYSENIFKFYPLLVFLVICACFIFIYLFRLISISFEEIRYHGLFSSRDRADITEGKELIITLLPKGKLKVELFGNDGTLPEYSWIKEDDGKPFDIFLFRGRAIGTRRTALAVLRYFGVNEEDSLSVFRDESFSGEYEFVTLVSKREEEKTVIRLKMKKTV